MDSRDQRQSPKRKSQQICFLAENTAQGTAPIPLTSLTEKERRELTGEISGRIDGWLKEYLGQNPDKQKQAAEYLKREYDLMEKE